MSFFIEDTGGSTFTPVPAGMHLARCYRIIDLGTQQTNFDGNVDYKRKLKVVWEIHGEDDTGKPIVTDKNEPMIITKDYTMSWNDKATLRKDLQSWRGREFTDEEQRRFDIKTVLDKWCMVNVAHKPKKTGTGVYANVVAVTPVPNAIKNALPKGHNKCGLFMISEPDMEMFETFGKYLKETIQAAPEWKAVQGRAAPAAEAPKGGFDDMESDVPF
jgi:hypothetical protein